MTRKHIKQLNRQAKRRKHGISKEKVFALSQETHKEHAINGR